MEFFITLTLFLFIVVIKGIRVVPQQEAWVIERFGKFDCILEPGLNLLLPFIQRVAYKHTLKESAMDVHQQTAITRDNVTLKIDGVLYVKIVDPAKASYGVTDPYYAVAQMAQTTMRSEIGQITLDKTFEERTTLNTNIVTAINEAAGSWGIQCMRYEIKDIDPPESVLRAMELQVAAERQKRAVILESEGQQQSKINLAEANKREVVLSSEADKLYQINRSQGEAEAVIALATASADGISRVAAALEGAGGANAASLKVAEQYIEAFSNLAQKGTTVLLPASTNDAASMVTQAMSIFKQLGGDKGEK